MTQRLNERQEAILEVLHREGEARISSLSTEFSVTEMTIRRDLEKLEELGVIRRTFGGAILVTNDVSLVDRNPVMLNEKVSIGRMVVKLIQPGSSIFLDAGTTTFQIARHLVPQQEVTVVTNGLNIAAELLVRVIHTMVIGGMLLEKTVSLVGPLAIEVLDKMAFDQVFLGATGFAVQHGFSNSNVLEAEVKRKVIQRATLVNVVMDNSKIGVKQLISYATLAEVHRIITDQPLDCECLEAMRGFGTEVLVSTKHDSISLLPSE